jgi:hypothetical protein
MLLSSVTWGTDIVGLAAATGTIVVTPDKDKLLVADDTSNPSSGGGGGTSSSISARRRAKVSQYTASAALYQRHFFDAIDCLHRNNIRIQNVLTHQLLLPPNSAKLPLHNQQSSPLIGPRFHFPTPFLVVMSPRSECRGKYIKWRI